MTDALLENNKFYQYLRKEFEAELLVWQEPGWRVCIPSNEALEGYELGRQFAESHVLQHTTNSGELYSLGCGRSRLFQLAEDALLWHQDTGAANNMGAQECPESYISQSASTGVLVNKITVLAEYFITIQTSLVHMLLVSDVLDPTLREEQALVSRLTMLEIASITQAEQFLRVFSCHDPVLQRLSEQLSGWQLKAAASQPLPHLQGDLHDLLLDTWDNLIRRHSSACQTNTIFQDLLYNALDFIVVGWCHSVVWWRVRERCGTMDDLVSLRLKHLRVACFTPEQLRLPAASSTPVATPAAVVELAALDTLESALDRLHCMHAAVQLLEAHAKQARAELHTFTGAECGSAVVSEEELQGLLTMALIEAQCQHLVSNLYYISHFVFSLPDNHPLRSSVILVRRALQGIMQLDLNEAVHTPCKPPLRKELSLLDLMKISSAVEQRFDRPRTAAATGSTPDISSLDLHWQQLTDRIQRSTMESSTISQSPVTCYSPRVESSPNSPYTPYYPLTTTERGRPGSNSPSNSAGLVNSFMEFMSTLPSSIRASMRRKQTEQRRAVETSGSREDEGVSSTPTTKQ